MPVSTTYVGHAADDRNEDNLPRDGTEPMEGDLNVAGFNIVDDSGAVKYVPLDGSETVSGKLTANRLKTANSGGGGNLALQLGDDAVGFYNASGSIIAQFGDGSATNLANL